MILNRVEVLTFMLSTFFNFGFSYLRSPAFQRFAVRTSRRIDDISNTGVFLLHFVIWTCNFSHCWRLIWWWVLFCYAAAKKKKELAEQVKDLSKNFEVIWYILNLISEELCYLLSSAADCACYVLCSLLRTSSSAEVGFQLYVAVSRLFLSSFHGC